MGSLGVSDRSVRRTMSRAGRVVAFVLASTVACQAGDLVGGDSDGGPDTALDKRLVMLGGDAQEDTVGAMLAAPYTVRLTDSRGQPLRGVAITWTITEGGGSVMPVSAVTDAEGRATAVHTLGPSVGNQAVRVSLASGGNAPVVTFCSQAQHGRPSQLAFVSDASDATLGAPIAPAMRLVWRDRFGNLADRASGVARLVIAPGTGTPLAEARGTLEVAFTNGTATFSNVWIDLPGADYRLRASAGALAKDTRAFDVVLIGETDASTRSAAAHGAGPS